MSNSRIEVLGVCLLRDSATSPLLAFPNRDTPAAGCQKIIPLLYSYVQATVKAQIFFKVTCDCPQVQESRASMSNSEALTDEYLAELMDKEAKRSLKYSGMGFEGDLTASKYVPLSIVELQIC